MSVDLSGLDGKQRLLLEADLRPVQGERFQPTGFPELGAATYTLPGGRDMLLVESEQSMANRLEAACWDEEAGDLAAPLRGMPYVRVWQNDQVLTNSILEAHRLNSPYILKSRDDAFFQQLRGQLGGNERTAVDVQTLARVAWAYDPNSVLHGIFLEKIQGRLRLQRLLSAFIEAQDVRPVESGGVKNDRVSPGAGPREVGFGNVPYARTQYVAATITAYFNLDLATLRGYRLGGEAERFLTLLAMWKIRRFLEEGLRLRTACDLVCSEVKGTRPEGFKLPEKSELEPALESALAQAQGFVEPPVTEVNFVPPANYSSARQESGQEGEGEE